MARRKIEDTVLDSTLPKTPIELNGKTYNLCLDFAALSEADSYYAANGHEEVCLLIQLPDWRRIENLRMVLPCALRTFHPEISFEDAQKLINPRTMQSVAQAIYEAHKAAMPDPEEKTANPQEPPANP